MIRILGIFSLLTLLSGCGTYYECVHPPSKGPRVYGGVKTDFEIRGFMYGDVPLSAIGDTLILPYTGAIALFEDDENTAKEDQEVVDQNTKKQTASATPIRED
jgi:uncharacterized protein YceK